MESDFHKRFGEEASRLWSDPVDRKLALGVVEELLLSGKYVRGLIEQADHAGLKSKLTSWLGTTCEHESFTAEEMARVLGQDLVRHLATKVDASERDALHRLARVVPQIAEQVLPAGQVKSAEVERIGLEGIRSNIIDTLR